MEIREIKTDGKGKWLSTTHNIKVGYVKEYNSVKKFGFIKRYNDEDLFFHISNSQIKNICVGDIIGFTVEQSVKYKNKFEATNINLAENFTQEFKEAKFKFSSTEWKMIMKGNSSLFLNSIDNGYLAKIELRENLSSHVLTTNIDDILELYKVKIICGGRWKRDGDDSAWIDIKGVWMPECNDWDMPDKYRYDIYLNNLFPRFNKIVFRESGFCSYQKMIAEYKEDKENWAKLEQEASNLEYLIKQKVKNEYNPKQHKIMLSEYLSHEIRQLVEKTECDVNNGINTEGWGKYNSIV